MYTSKAEKDIIETVHKEGKEKYQLTESSMVDYMVLYSLARKFIVPFNKMKAYKLGLIDANGNILKSPETKKERDAFTPLDNIVIRIKRLIPKNLWYLLTFGYIFKGFASRKEYKKLYEEDLSISQIEEEEKKNIILESRYNEVMDIIENDPSYTEEDFWNYAYNKRR